MNSNIFRSIQSHLKVKNPPHTLTKGGKHKLLLHCWPVQGRTCPFLGNPFSLKARVQVQHGPWVWKQGPQPGQAHVLPRSPIHFWLPQCFASPPAAVQLKDRIMQHIQRHLCIKKGPLPRDSAAWNCDWKDKAWRKRRTKRAGRLLVWRWLQFR